MKATRTHQWTSLLLSGALVAGMMITPSLAAGGAELEFQYPSDVKAFPPTAARTPSRPCPR